MKALAELLAGSGWTVSGSDANATSSVALALAQRGLRIHPGHHCGFLAEQTDVLVYSSAVGPENAERVEARRRGIPQLSYSQMLGRLMHGHSGVCIAGTHGKSTTTAMTGCILTAAGLAPSVVIGAEVSGIGANGWHGDGELFVVESCEFQRSFLDLSPRYAAILGIEPDHFDYFASFDETIAAFAAFAQKAPADGRLLIHAGCEATKAACIAASWRRSKHSASTLRPTGRPATCARPATAPDFVSFMPATISRKSHCGSLARTTCRMPWRPQRWLTRLGPMRPPFARDWENFRESAGASSGSARGAESL